MEGLCNCAIAFDYCPVIAIVQLKLHSVYSECLYLFRKAFNSNLSLFLDMN